MYSICVFLMGINVSNHIIYGSPTMHWCIGCRICLMFVYGLSKIGINIYQYVTYPNVSHMDFAQTLKENELAESWHKWHKIKFELSSLAALWMPSFHQGSVHSVNGPEHVRDTKKRKKHWNWNVTVLPAAAWAADPPGQWGPPARGRCSGIQRRRTAAPRRGAGGSAGRRAPSPAGSCSAGGKFVNK